MLCVCVRTCTKVFSVLSVKVRTVSTFTSHPVRDEVVPCSRLWTLLWQASWPDLQTILCHSSWLFSRVLGDLNPDPHARMTSTLNAESASFLDLLGKEKEMKEEGLLSSTLSLEMISLLYYIQLGPIWKSQSKGAWRAVVAELFLPQW